MSFNILSKKKQIHDIIIEKPFKLKNKSKRCLLYLKQNNNISLPYIRTPRLKLYFSLSESKWNSVKLSLHPYLSYIKDFIKIIKALEKNIQTRINCKAKFQSCLNLVKNEMKTIRLYFSRTCKIDSSLGNLKIEDLKRDSEVRLLIKIPYIWFRDNKYGIYFCIQRIKYYPSPLLLDINFWDDEEEPIYPPNKIRWMEKCPECTNNIYSVGNKTNISSSYSYTPKKIPIQKVTITPKQPIKTVCRPSIKDLLNMKNKLRKITKS